MHIIWLVFAILAFIGTLGVCVMISLANGMSDAPMQEGISTIPALVIGMFISGSFAALFFFA